MIHEPPIGVDLICPHRGIPVVELATFVVFVMPLLGPVLVVVAVCAKVASKVDHKRLCGYCGDVVLVREVSQRLNDAVPSGSGYIDGRGVFAHPALCHSKEAGVCVGHAN